jgi:uncharacterized membrane protein YfhO
MARGRWEIFAGLTVVLCALLSTCLDGYVTTNARGRLTDQTFPRVASQQLDQSTTQALDFIKSKDDGTYRVEKTYTDWMPAHNDALIQGYKGVAFYNSVIDTDVAIFFNKLWPGAVKETAFVYPELDLDHPDLMAYLGVKYVLSKDELAYDWLEDVASFGDVRVYENKRFRSFGTAYGSFVTEESLEQDESRWEGIESQVVVKEATGIANPAKAGGNNAIELEWRSQSHLTGRVLSDGGAIVSVPVPNTDCWVVEVDGQVQRTYCTNYGFLGFDIEAGQHEISIRYAPFGTTYGLVCAILGILLLAVSCVACNRLARKRDRI